MFCKVVYNVEEKLKVVNFDGLIVKMLMMCCYEKDFMLCGVEKYIGCIDSWCSEFVEMLLVSGFLESD